MSEPTMRPSSAPLAPHELRFWLERRKALLIEVNAIEAYCGLPRTETARRERERLAFERRRGGEGEG